MTFVMPAMSPEARRHFAAAATYALAGPPLAGLLLVLAGFLVTVVSDAEFRGSPSGAIAGLLVMGLLGIPFSYLFGGLQAVFVGIGCARWQLRRGPVPLALPLVLSLFAWIGFSFVTWLTNEPPVGLAAVMFSQNGALWLANHLFAGGVCWWLARRWAVWFLLTPPCNSH